MGEHAPTVCSMPVERRCDGSAHSESGPPMVQTGASSEALATPHSCEIASLARKSAKWSLGLLVARQGIGLVSTALLARLISPAEYGLVAMVTVFTAFLGLLDSGLGWATVQAKELNSRMVNSLFWFGMLWGLFLWAVCAASGALLARFYGHAELAGICVVLGAGLLLNSLAAQPSAILKRKMRQQMLSGIETGAVLVASATALVLAVNGWGYWALAAQVVVVYLVRMAALLVLSDFHPRSPYSISWQGLGLLRFSAYMGGCSWITYFQLYLDNILVGRFCGAANLGYYTRATYLQTLPTMYAVQSMNDVMVPALAALQQDRVQLGQIYRKALTMVAFVGCPAGAFLGVAAQEIVLVLYGPAWQEVIPLLVWLSFPATILPIYNTAPWLFIATGKSREFFWLSLILTPIVAVAYFLVVQSGPLHVTFARCLLFTVPIPLATLYWSHRSTGIDFRETCKTIWPVLVSCVCAVLGATLAGQALALVTSLPIVSLLAKAVAGGLVYLGSARILMVRLPLYRRLA